MKVHVFEPFAGWHHTKYVALLLPTLVRMRSAGLLSDVIVTTTTSHYQSEYFADLLSEFEPFVTFDIIPATHHSLRGFQVSQLLVEAVRRIRPDCVIATSANNGLAPLAANAFFGSPISGHDMISVGVIHNGFAGPVRGIRNRLSDGIQRFGRRYSPWSELHVVNPLLYKTAVTQNRNRVHRVKLLPDPVLIPAKQSRRGARELLGIPLDGRYVGQIGKSDGRKAIPELLSAFRSAKLNSDDRLLIAGKLYEPYRDLIERDFAELLLANRIILIDRYLSEHELNAAYFAVDVAAVSYYIEELSGVMLAAIAAGRPVIASQTGYTGMIIRMFDVGWSVDIRNPTSFVAGIETALSESANYAPSDRAERLLAFHDPQNFVDTLLRSLYERLGLPTVQIKTWDWVINDSDSSQNGAC